MTLTVKRILKKIMYAFKQEKQIKKNSNDFLYIMYVNRHCITCKIVDGSLTSDLIIVS